MIVVHELQLEDLLSEASQADEQAMARWRAICYCPAPAGKMGPTSGPGGHAELAKWRREKTHRGRGHVSTQVTREFLGGERSRDHRGGSERSDALPRCRPGERDLHDRPEIWIHW